MKTAALIALSALCLLTGCNDAKSTAETKYKPAWEDMDKPVARYPGPWHDEPNAGIIRTLAGQGVTGCGELHYRVAYNVSSEFLVACTRDGKKWTPYLVFPNINRVVSMAGQPDMPPAPR